MPPITNRVIFWHTVRCFLWAKLLHFLKSRIKAKSSRAVLIAFLGGSLLYKILIKAFEKILCWFLGMKNLGVIDEFFLYDDNTNLSNTSLSMFLTKHEFQPMSDYILEQTKMIPEMNVKVYDLFGK